MEKLTLSVDAHVVAMAKTYARARGTSVSQLVESFLRMVSAAGTSAPSGASSAAAPPVLAQLRGSLKRGSIRDYRRHLERKYR